MKDGTWIVAAVFGIALSIGLAYWFSLPKSRFDEKTVSAAEDEIYEAVVRDMVTPIKPTSNMGDIAI
jgi:hypothetical protein